MTGMKEIRDHIKSVQQTLKITNAMYLISSANLRRARKQLNDVLPYFTKIYNAIADILQRSPELNHPYFDRRLHIPREERMKRTVNPRLFVMGHVGRTYFADQGYQMEPSFGFGVQDPTMAQARTISEIMVEKFQKQELDEVHLIYTEMVTPLELRVRELRLLPLVRSDFPRLKEQKGFRRTMDYVPSVDAVLDNIVPGYVKGMIFGGLVESFCSEQNARMTAMQTANDNASDMLKKLSLSYNQARQTAITQEITEIVGGSGLFTQS